MDSLSLHLMSTNISSQASAFSDEKLPFEIILLILDLALQSHATPDVMFRFCLVSKAIHNWILPRLYHTLNLRTTNHANRISTAPRSSLLFTRRLFFWVTTDGPDVSPFSNLSHLSLWTSNLPGLAGPLIMLPLEEMLVFNQASMAIIAGLLTSEATLWKTIQRILCYGAVDKNWFECPNLVQIFVMHYSVNRYVQADVVLPSSSNFRTYVASPAYSSNPRPAFSREDAEQCPVHDRRLILLGEIPRHLDKPHGSFWENQAAMWEMMLRAVEENEIDKVTVVDSLPPWSERTGSYIFS
ncbi:hypothetical protein DL96DRAFT_1589940 [Flagelloscypha sp. PMI_526]|nr:hypothetical protein DL96DRAFT_1589940 [Flagelloscypha sp. PMI_526]